MTSWLCWRNTWFLKGPDFTLSSRVLYPFPLSFDGRKTFDLMNIALLKLRSGWVSCGLIMLLGACGDPENPAVPTVFSISSTELPEGATTASKTLTVFREGVADALTVNYTIAPATAAETTDLVGATGVLEFAAGATEARVNVTVVGDEWQETTEYFVFSFTFKDRTESWNIYIKDDDGPAPIQSDQDGFLTPATYPSMTLQWADEFNADQLSAANWNYDLGNGCAVGLCGWGNNEKQEYTNDPANIRVESGKLVITAITTGNNFKSARINSKSKQTQTFGRIDIRAKLPKGKGIWPALWMLGANIDQNPWPGCGEIDVMELVGNEPSRVWGTVHYSNNGYVKSDGFLRLASGDFSDKYHVFSILWDQDAITWYVDNQQFKIHRRSPGTAYPFNAPFYFVMNIAVGGNWPGDPDGTTVFPQQMLVDYIRVFR